MKNFIAISCMLATLLVVSTAQAFIVTTSVGTFDIETVQTQYTEVGTPALFENQPWWGDDDIAEEFRDAVGLNLGLPNNDEGPWFAWRLFESTVVSIKFCDDDNGACAADSGGNGITTRGEYAVASPVPVPAAAWLFMSGLLGLIWKGRKARQSVA